MIVSEVLVVFGLIGCIVKLYVIAETRKRLTIARKNNYGGYADRTGVTTLNLQWMMLAVIALMTVAPALVLIDPATTTAPITVLRIVRGVAYIAADLLVVFHAFYAAWRYVGDVAWEPLNKAQQPEEAAR